MLARGLCLAFAFQMGTSLSACAIVPHSIISPSHLDIMMAAKKSELHTHTHKASDNFHDREFHANEPRHASRAVDAIVERGDEMLYRRKNVDKGKKASAR